MSMNVVIAFYNWCQLFLQSLKKLSSHRHIKLEYAEAVFWWGIERDKSIPLPIMSHFWFRTEKEAQAHIADIKLGMNIVWPGLRGENIMFPLTMKPVQHCGLVQGIDNDRMEAKVLCFTSGAEYMIRTRHLNKFIDDEI
jgi:hypothetical protein